MKHLFLAGVLLGTSLPTWACDVCGIFLGIQPNDRSTSFGLYYRFRHLEGDLGGISLLKHGGGHSGEAAAAPSHYAEQYQVLEARADIWFTQRFALMASVPVVNNYQSVDGYATADVYGIGDPFVLGRFVVANTRCLTDAPRTVHRVTLGVGVKFPLGRTDMEFAEASVPHDLQPGTGTWDALASAEYMVRRNKVGGSLAVFGRYNGSDRNAYQLGHGLSTTAEAFYQVPLGSFTWAPSLGGYVEHTGMDHSDGTVVDGTGSTTLFTHAGSRMWWHSWMLSVNHQLAVARSTGEWMVPNRQRVIVGITYNLIRKTNTP